MNVVVGSTLEGLDRADTFFQDSVVFVGMNPSVKGSNKGSTFGRLNVWIEELQIKKFGFMNAYPNPGKCKVSDVNLDNLRRALYNARKVVALGNFAAEALEKAGIHHFKLPHPSPLNRQINDLVFINRKLAECLIYLTN